MIQHLEDPKKKARSSGYSWAIAQVCGVNRDWLEREIGLMVDGVNDSAATYAVPASRLTHRIPEDAFITVEHYDAAASAGPGEEVLDEENVIGNMRIARSWLAGRIGRYTSEQNLKVLSAMGDSMVPTFNDGDILMVDTGIRDVDRDGIFVLRAHNRLYVKRVRKKFATGTYEVSSDNPKAGLPEELSGNQQLDVLGKVVGAWNWSIM